MEPLNRHAKKRNEDFFSWDDEPKPARLRFLIIGAMIALLVALIAWKAIPNIARSIYDAQETAKLIQNGY